MANWFLLFIPEFFTRLVAFNFLQILMQLSFNTYIGEGSSCWWIHNDPWHEKEIEPSRQGVRWAEEIALWLPHRLCYLLSTLWYHWHYISLFLQDSELRQWSVSLLQVFQCWNEHSYQSWWDHCLNRSLSTKLSRHEITWGSSSTRGSLKWKLKLKWSWSGLSVLKQALVPILTGPLPQQDKYEISIF